MPDALTNGAGMSEATDHDRDEDQQPEHVGNFPDLSDAIYSWPSSPLIGLCAQAVATLRLGGVVLYVGEHRDGGYVLANDVGRVSLAGACAIVLAPAHAERQLLRLPEDIVRARHQGNGIGLAQSIFSMDPLAAVYGDRTARWLISEYANAITDLAAQVDERGALDGAAVGVFAVCHSLTNQPDPPPLATYRAFESKREKTA